MVKCLFRHQIKLKIRDLHGHLALPIYNEDCPNIGTAPPPPPPPRSLLWDTWDETDNLKAPFMCLQTPYIAALDKFHHLIWLSPSQISYRN